MSHFVNYVFLFHSLGAFRIPRKSYVNKLILQADSKYVPKVSLFKVIKINHWNIFNIQTPVGITYTTCFNKAG
jgi:hypothetical protein